MFFHKWIDMVFLTVAALFLFGVQGFAAEQEVRSGQLRMYLYQAGTGTRAGGVNDLHVSVGDTIDVDAFLTNMWGESISGLCIYLTVDSKYFDIVSQGRNKRGSIRPFEQGNYMCPAGNPIPFDPVGNWMHRDSLDAVDNKINGWQLDYVQISGVSPYSSRPVSVLSSGVACTFRLVAKAPCDSATITLDDDHYNGRVASYMKPGSSDTYAFRSFSTCYITANTPSEVNTGTPWEFVLGQNFPNPFNPTTTISFSVPNASDVTLKVYDVLGRNVRTLVSGSYLPGNYSVVWDARDARGSMVSSGTYFYSITAGNYHSSKRMLFLK